MLAAPTVDSFETLHADSMITFSTDLELKHRVCSSRGPTRLADIRRACSLSVLNCLATERVSLVSSELSIFWMGFLTCDTLFETPTIADLDRRNTGAR
jgi:hypothetical protein